MDIKDQRSYDHRTSTSGWIAVIGDAGHGDDDPAGNTAVSQLVRSWKPDLVVHSGDTFYDATSFGDALVQLERQVGDFYGWAIDSGRLVVALGNHDRDNNAYEAVRQYYSQPVPTFSRRVGDLEVFVSDTPYGSGNTLTSPDAVTVLSGWLRDIMLASTARDKVVVLHHPPYSSTTYAAPGAAGGFPALRWDFKTWGAKLVISGHHHVYERLAVGDLAYAVVGNGGSNLANFSTILPESQFRYRGFGATRMKSADNGLIVESYDNAGNLLDWATL